MKKLLTILLLTASFGGYASPIMQGGQALRPQTHNPSTTYYLKKLHRANNQQAKAKVPDGCWIAYNNAQITNRVKAKVGRPTILSDDILYAILYGIGYTPFACQ